MAKTEKITDYKKPTKISQEKSSQYCLVVSERTLEKIKKHLSLRKAVGEQDHTQKQWFKKAVQNKLKREEISREIPKQTQICVELAPEITEKISKSVQFCRAVVSSTYSKKKWILDAIEEQIEEDQTSLQKRLKSLNEN